MNRSNLRALNTVALLGVVIVVCMVFLGITRGVSIGIPILLCNTGSGPTCSVTLAPTTSFNPVRTPHTVTATIQPNSSGVPVFFIVTSGVNVGTQFGPCNTVAGATDATCSSSYTPGNATSGKDVIEACGDFDATSANVPDDADFRACRAGDVAGENGDVRSINTVDKFWLENFCTGGGRIGVGGKPTHTFGYTFGANPVADPAPDFVGNVQITRHTPSTLPCHFNTFFNLVFSCDTGNVPCTNSPPSNNNVCDVDIAGTCQGVAVSGHLRVEDHNEPGTKAPKDRISYTKSTGPLESFAEQDITGGNLQAHQTF